MPKPVFLQAGRRPLIYFVTSSSDKLIQARLLFSKFGLELQTFQDAPDYVEDYSQSKEKLLEVGVREVARTLGTSALFFLEDTSVRIEAISSETEDHPGLAIKDWFSPTEMEQLAKRIAADQLDPRAVVRSDIALHVPGLDRPVFFSGETRGTIASEAPSFERDPRYPWLRPDTFNGWLIPDGAGRRLGEMDFEASLAYDFRAIALRALLDRLEEFTAALNMPAQAYAVRSRTISAQPQLPLSTPPSLLVVGHTCAGKTTFGERATMPGLDLLHIEASHVMRTIPLPEETPDDLTAFNRANILMLQGGRDVVARRIIDIYSQEMASGFVITGFRTLEELELLKRTISWARIVYVDSSEATRYQRFLDRERPDDALSLERFRSRDAEHELFGLLSVGEQVADVRIRNEGPLSEYFAQIDAVVTGRTTRVRGISGPLSDDSIRRSQLFRILSVLGDAKDPLSPSDIERATSVNKSVGTVKRSSVRKVLGDAPSLVRRYGEEATYRYDLTESGRSYLNVVRARLGEIRFLGSNGPVVPNRVEVIHKPIE